MDVAARFSENLVRHRIAADLTQEQLAERAGLEASEVARLERGTEIALVSSLVQLAGALDVPPGELLDGIH